MVKTSSYDVFDKKAKRNYSSAQLLAIYRQMTLPPKLHSPSTINKAALPPPPKMEIQETHHCSDSEKRFLDTVPPRTTSYMVKINHLKKKQCFVSLKRLMVHPDAWPFKNVMNEKALADLDCHDMILKPGQPLVYLDTLKWKLEKGLYTYTNQFVGDVRILFCNAMAFYPVSHEIHRIAMKLWELFEMKWKILEVKWAAEEEKPKPNPLENATKVYGTGALKGGKKRKLSVFEGNEENTCPNSKRQALTDAKLLTEKVMSNAKPEQHFLDTILVAQSNLFGDNNGLLMKKEREASRVMLQKIERTVFIDDSLNSFKELERLCGYSLTDINKVNPLKEILGLVLKDGFRTMTDLDEEKFLDREWEEGEILYLD